MTLGGCAVCWLWVPCVCQCTSRARQRGDLARLFAVLKWHRGVVLEIFVVARVRGGAA